jgi:MFS family permease
MSAPQTTAPDGSPQPVAAGKHAFSGASFGSWMVLAFLLLIGLYMYADRPIITLQTDAVKAALDLTDFQIGLVQGLGVALFAAFAGYPIASLADRFDGRLILAVSIVVWCLAVAGCGLSQNFTQLFLASAFVGAGEAALLPITYATIPMLFTGRSRLTANALLTVSGRLASGGVIVLSGLLVENVGGLQPVLPAQVAEFENWRLALLVLALPAPVLAIASLMVRLRLKPQDVTLPLQQPAGVMPVRPFLQTHLRTSLGPVYIGVALLVFGASAFGAFLPVVAMRQMGASPSEVGAGVGSATMVSALIAILLLLGGGGVFMRRLGPAYPVRLLMMTSLLTGIVSLGYLVVATPQQMYVLMGVTFLFISLGTMAFPTALQDLMPAPLRTRLMAIAIMINIVFSALAPAVVGLASDMLGHLLRATVIVGVTAMILSAALLAFAGRSYLATSALARSIEHAEEPRDE